MNKPPLLSLALALIGPLAACSSHAVPDEARPYVEALRSCESMELFAIDPSSGYDAPVEAPDRLRGCRVLGQSSVAGAAERGEIARLVAEGIARSDGSLAHCFLPRHGLRVRSATGVHELVVCYECLTVQAWAPGATTAVTLPTANSVEPELTALYERLGLKIAGRE